MDGMFFVKLCINSSAIDITNASWTVRQTFATKTVHSSAHHVIMSCVHASFAKTLLLLASRRKDYSMDHCLYTRENQ